MTKFNSRVLSLTPCLIWDTLSPEKQQKPFNYRQGVCLELSTKTSSILTIVLSLDLSSGLLLATLLLLRLRSLFSLLGLVLVILILSSSLALLRRLVVVVFVTYATQQSASRS